LALAAQLAELQIFNQLEDEAELETILILLEDLYLLQQPLAAAREVSWMRLDLQVALVAVAAEDTELEIKQAERQLQVKDLQEVQV
jgi:hypothetical protein